MAVTPVIVLGGPTRGNRALLQGLSRLGLGPVLAPPLEARRRVPADGVAVARLDVRPTLDGIEDGLLELLWLERSGARVVNGTRALLAAHDKLRTARLLGAAGLPQPDTVHVAEEEELAALVPPLVVKPRFGSWGRDVYRCRDRAELERCLTEVRGRAWFRRHGALAQELLPAQGSDLRLLVAAGEVVGAVERTAAPGEWRTNVSLGGSIRPARPPSDAWDLAHAAAAASGADLVGVDLLRTEAGGWVVLELNGAVEFDERYSLAGRDVYADLVEALRLGAEPVARSRRGSARVS